MSNIDLHTTVVINGERRTSREVFRASRTLWVRYERRNGENGYATAAEWEEWLLKSEARVEREFRQPTQDEAEV